MCVCVCMRCEHGFVVCVRQACLSNSFLLCTPAIFGRAVPHRGYSGCTQGYKYLSTPGYSYFTIQGW